MTTGKCGGGKKLGITLNFPTEKAFVKYVRGMFVACRQCGTIYRKKDTNCPTCRLKGEV